MALAVNTMVDVYKVYDFFVMISSFETIAGAPED